MKRVIAFFLFIVFFPFFSCKQESEVKKEDYIEHFYYEISGKSFLLVYSESNNYVAYLTDNEGNYLYAICWDRKTKRIKKTTTFYENERLSDFHYYWNDDFKKIDSAAHYEIIKKTENNYDYINVFFNKEEEVYIKIDSLFSCLGYTYFRFYSKKSYDRIEFDPRLSSVLNPSNALFDSDSVVSIVPLVTYFQESSGSKVDSLSYISQPVLLTFLNEFKSNEFKDSTTFKGFRLPFVLASFQVDSMTMVHKKINSVVSSVYW